MIANKQYGLRHPTTDDWKIGVDYLCFGKVDKIIEEEP